MPAAPAPSLANQQAPQVRFRRVRLIGEFIS
jgi:hypothetical protein